MLEIPEATTIARQLIVEVSGRSVTRALAGRVPHGYVFWSRSPADYGRILPGLPIDDAVAYGGIVEIQLDNWRLAFSEGARLRWIPPGSPLPQRDQLQLELDDGSALVCTVDVAAVISLTQEGRNDDPRYLAALAAVSPLTDAFTVEHLSRLMAAVPGRLSVMELLTMQQRIPGFGSGCLSDVAFLAEIHPRRRIDTLTPGELPELHRLLVETVRQMTASGGRDTQFDLYGNPGGYRTLLSAKTHATPCPRCGVVITRKVFHGETVYACPGCQATN